MAESLVTYRPKRVTLGAAGIATRFAISSTSATGIPSVPASNVFIRPEVSDVRVSFIGTDGVAIGTNYLELPAGVTTTLPCARVPGTGGATGEAGSLFIAPVVGGSVVQVLFTF